ncbi:hypothetical protein J6590_061175 [Homalodisca vitripennis]|nr:hypothetical protein J6590_061175 [Homalodisca vitripennis]
MHNDSGLDSQGLTDRPNRRVYCATNRGCNISGSGRATMRVGTSAGQPAAGGYGTLLIAFACSYTLSLSVRERQCCKRRRAAAGGAPRAKQNFPFSFTTRIARILGVSREYIGYPPITETVIGVVDMVQGISSVYLTLTVFDFQTGHFKTKCRAAFPVIASSPYLPPDGKTYVTLYQPANRRRLLIVR